MNSSADAVLKSYSLTSRQQMARAHGLDGKNKGSEAVNALLEPALFDAAQVQSALERLSPGERVLLDHLVLLGGEGPTIQLRRTLEQAGVVDLDAKANDPWRGVEQAAKGSPLAENSRNFSDLVARLGALGLVYSSNPGQRGLMELSRPGYRLYIPDAVFAQLPRQALPVETTQPPALVQAADPAMLLRDVFVLLSTANDRPIPITKAGQIQKRLLVQIGGLLRVKEDVAAARSQDDLSYLPFLRALTEQLRLLTARQGELRLGDAAPAFLAESRAQRRLQLYQAYSATDQWSELFQIPALSIRAAGSRIPIPHAFVVARQRVLTTLAALPAERWITLEHVVERIRQTDYEFLFRREHPDRDYFSTYSYAGTPNPYGGTNETGWTFDGIYREDEGWNRVEAPFIRTVVTLAFAWLGGVDLGYANDRLVAFRLTADGARLLNGEPPQDGEAAAPNVVVQPNFQLFAFEPTDEGILFRLNQIADRVRVDQATEYRLTRESVFRAQRAGWEVAGILSFLDDVSNVPLPQNVRRSIEEWGAERERVTFRREAGVLQTASAAALDALIADGDVAPLLGRRVTPTMATVSVANLTALYRRLLEQGQLPALSEGGDEVAAPSLVIAADGVIAFHDPVPSMYVLRAVQPFVDGTPPEPTRLTPESLRRAAKAGMTAEQILRVLQANSAGSLPSAVETLVQRWAKDWGRGALVNVTLLQIEQAATLAGLLDDPDIKRYLTPVPGAPALALIRPDGVDAVRAALAALGIDLSDQLLL